MGAYSVVAKVASGGMATVYLAYRRGDEGGGPVALKRLHPHLASEKDFVDMFLDEARLSARIHHPNVVELLDIGHTDEGHFLVMEYVEGATLGKLWAHAEAAGEPLPLPVALRIALDALAGLEAAHEQRDEAGRPLDIVHRDVSPQNILVGRGGVTKITDFGVARASSRLAATRSGQLKGKMAYMAPEQALGKAGAIDRRADVFAMGIVLWEALVGRWLFRSENEAQTFFRLMNEPIAHPCDVSLRVPRALGDACMGALERNREQRFPTARAFAEALAEAARASGIAVATAAQVAAHTELTVGGELAQRRQAVDDGTADLGSAPESLTRMATEGVLPGEHSTAAVTRTDGASGKAVVALQQSRRRNRVWLAAGGTVAVLGVASFLLVRTRIEGGAADRAAAAAVPAPAADHGAVLLRVTPPAASAAPSSSSAPIAVEARPVAPEVTPPPAMTTAPSRSRGKGAKAAAATPPAANLAPAPAPPPATPAAEPTERPHRNPYVP